jgi:hypothetical protein
MGRTGYDSEKLTVEAYETAGYDRVFTPPKAKFAEQDIFGLFDVAAYHHRTGLTFTQVKTNGAGGITSFFEDSDFLKDEHRINCEFVVRHTENARSGGVGWRVARRSYPRGYTWVFDNRAETLDDVAEPLADFLEPPESE